MKPRFRKITRGGMPIRYPRTGSKKDAEFMRGHSRNLKSLKRREQGSRRGIKLPINRTIPVDKRRTGIGIIQTGKQAGIFVYSEGTELRRRKAGLPYGTQQVQRPSEIRSGTTVVELEKELRRRARKEHPRGVYKQILEREERLTRSERLKLKKITSELAERSR